MNRKYQWHVVLAAVVAVSVMHREIAGCSCLKGDYGFLVPSGVTLPSNALGVPWAGGLRREGKHWIYPRKDLFLVQRLDSAGDWVTIDFDLHEIRGELIGDSTMYIVLVVPDDGMMPGACYRFGFGPLHHRDDGGRIMSEGVVVTVDHEPFKPDTTEYMLRVGDTRRAPLEVMTLSGACSTKIEAAQAEIEMPLPVSVEKWRDALLYTVIISDHDYWRPYRSFCGSAPPGSSWVGKGRELVFSQCTGTLGSSGEPYFNLQEGTHSVRMIAWLPGISATVRARADVALKCE